MNIQKCYCCSLIQCNCQNRVQYCKFLSPVYDQIVDFVVKTQKASASLLQRKFKIGYNKAATMIDKLEEDGIIGPATGNSKPREVLIKYSESDNQE